MQPMVWFRNDLRTRDNTALSRAAHDASGAVVGVFLLCPGQWREHDWGGPKVDFILRSLKALSQGLKQLNIPLRILRAERFSQAPSALLQLAGELGCDAVYFNREPEHNERRRDAAVRAAFDANRMIVREFDDACLLPPGEVLTDAEGWYTVYTPFRRKFKKVFDACGGVTLSAKPRRQPRAVCASDPVPERLSGFEPNGLECAWPAGEAAALERLTTFIERGLDDYHQRRDHPGSRATSTLSPYLACGAISARLCLSAATESAGSPPLAEIADDSGPGRWISELLWREFFLHLLAGFPRLSRGSNFRHEYDRLPWRSDEGQLEAWKRGLTGIPIVDAGMRELAATGWMHNRCRMIVSMFLTKNLLIDWRLGEQHFMRSLVDGNLASNNGGWQWAASTGTDAAPYFRVFNPISQSRRIDPDGRFIRRWLPELQALDDNSIHEPPGDARASVGYPAAIVDLKESRARAIRVFQECRR